MGWPEPRSTREHRDIAVFTCISYTASRLLHCGGGERGHCSLLRARLWRCGSSRPTSPLPTAPFARSYPARHGRPQYHRPKVKRSTRLFLTASPLGALSVRSLARLVMLPLLARAGCPRSPLLAGRTRIPRPLPGSTTLPRLSSSLTARTRTRPSLSLALPSTPTRALVVSSTHRSSPPHSAFSELVHPSPPPPPIAPPTILDTALPKWAEGAKPYLLLARVDKPIGSVLLYWPCGECAQAPGPRETSCAFMSCR